MNFLIAFILLFFSSNAFAADYTVCADGCTSATIQGVITGQAIGAGDTITIDAGTYSEAVSATSADQGGVGGVVLVVPETGEVVTIDGTGQANGLALNASSYWTFNGIDVSGSTTRNVYWYGTASNNTLTNFEITGSATGILLVAQTALTLSNGTVTGASQHNIFPANGAAGIMSNVTSAAANNHCFVFGQASAVGNWTISDIIATNSVADDNIAFDKIGAATVAITNLTSTGAALDGVNISAYTGTLSIDGGNINGNGNQGLYASLITGTLQVENLNIGVTGAGNADVGAYFNACTGITIFDNIVLSYNAGTNGMQWINTASVGAGSRITDCTISNNTTNGFVVSAGTCPGLVHCTITGNGGDGYQANNATTAASIRRSTITTSGSGLLGSASGEGITHHGTASGIYIEYCLIHSNERGGVAGDASGTGTMYNCTLYNNNTREARGEFMLTLGSGNWTRKNNIFYNTVDEQLVVADTWAQIAASSNNCYYASAATPFTVGGTDYNFADYIAAGRAALNATFEADSIYGDPLFTNAAGGDFTLQTGSPCIDTGADLSLTEDLTGGTVPINSIPEMGAFEYTPTPASTGMSTVLKALLLMGVLN